MCITDPQPRPPKETPAEGEERGSIYRSGAGVPLYRAGLKIGSFTVTSYLK